MRLQTRLARTRATLVALIRTRDNTAPRAAPPPASPPAALTTANVRLAALGDRDGATFIVGSPELTRHVEALRADGSSHAHILAALAQ